MTYVVTSKCIKCKYTDCAAVCPVKCFYEGENMLVINPDECIDCGVCELECPIGAIKSEGPDLVDMLELNKKYSSLWPRISHAKAPMKCAEQYANVEEDKLPLFSPRQGSDA